MVQSQVRKSPSQAIASSNIITSHNFSVKLCKFDSFFLIWDGSIESVDSLTCILDDIYGIWDIICILPSM